MAHWLARAKPPAYGIEDDAHTRYDLLIWPDLAVTRVDVGTAVPDGAKRIYSGIPGNAYFGFLSLQDDGRLKFYEQQLGFIPFSTYDIGARPPQSLAIRYTPPDRENKKPQKLSPLPPRGTKLVTYEIRFSGQHFELSDVDSTTAEQDLSEAPEYGVLIKTKIPTANCRLNPV